MYSLEIPASKFKKTMVPRFWYVDITEDIQRFVAASRVKEGIVVVATEHTTAGLIVNENEPGLIEKDLPEMLVRLCPDNGKFKHDSEERLRELAFEPINGVAHLRTMLASDPSWKGIIHKSTIVLGKWQSIIFMDFDLDGRPSRTVNVQVVGIPEHPRRT